MRYLARLLLVIPAMLGLLLATDSAANAAPGDKVYVASDLYLTANPVDGMNTACKSRTITLAADTYTWYEAIGSTAGYNNVWGSAQKSIYLAAGGYTWNVCLDPKNGAYVETSTFTPNDHNLHPTTLTSVLTVVGTSGTWRMWSSLVS